MKDQELNFDGVEREPLKSFPAQLGPWSATDVAIDKDVLQVLGPGDFLLREYHPEVNNLPELRGSWLCCLLVNHGR